MLHGTSLLRIIFKAINLHTYKSDGFFKVIRASSLLFLFRYIKGMTQVLLPGKRVQVRKNSRSNFVILLIVNNTILIMLVQRI